MGDGSGEPAHTALVAVTTEPATTQALAQWLGEHVSPAGVAVRTGYYAGVAAIGQGTPVVVVDVGAAPDRETWRLAELRTRAPGATIVVIADATLLPALSGTLHADLALTSVSGMPPFRELLVSTEPVQNDGDGQTIRRRSRR